MLYLVFFINSILRKWDEAAFVVNFVPSAYLTACNIFFSKLLKTMNKKMCSKLHGFCLLPLLVLLTLSSENLSEYFR